MAQMRVGFDIKLMLGSVFTQQYHDLKLVTQLNMCNFVEILSFVVIS